jgi:hypothetical protein
MDRINERKVVAWALDRTEKEPHHRPRQLHPHRQQQQQQQEEEEDGHLYED